VLSLLGGFCSITNIEQLVIYLSKLPFEAWNALIENDPEYFYFKSVQDELSCGNFSTLLVMAGLNAYQLKGYAEKAYWEKLSNWIKQRKVPSSPLDLIGVLDPFFKNERLHTGKRKRLKRFLSSDLANWLWCTDCQSIATDFTKIWYDLAKTMGQKKTDKTICFAMKCLAASLMMYECYEFSFCLPIPVDSRISKWTSCLNLCSVESKSSVQGIWDEVLTGLQEFEPKINMIHLDCLLWQTAVLDDEQLKGFFCNCGCEEVALFLSEQRNNQEL